MSNQEFQEFQLSYLNDNDRLKAYQIITEGCAHLWSKGKLQEDKLNGTLSNLMNLADKDPYFLARFTSYAIKKLDSKDLKVLTVFANSLSDADGKPFIVEHDNEGRPVYSDKFKKPNLRIVSQAGVQGLNPKLVSRVIEIANIKQPLGDKYKEGTHFSNSLKTAVKKYIKFRENNPKAMEGIKKAGFAPTIKHLYRMLHIAPSEETAEILGWQQKKGKKIKKKKLFDFNGMDDLQIAEKIRNDNLPPLGVLGALPDKISPVIAVAILEQASGDQAVILRGLFDSQGLLKDKEVMKVFESKIKTAKTALDRVDKINTEVDEAVEKTLKKAKAEKRKEDVGNIGKIFIHLDISSSMDSAIEFAKERGAIIAECIQNPEENFHWGAFNDLGYGIPKPKSFEKDGFMSALYGIRASGMTDCLACYTAARRVNADVDIYITDQQHNGYPMEQRIRDCDNKGLGRPKAVVIVDFSKIHSRYRYREDEVLRDVFEQVGIPVTVVQPDTLTESALVTQAIKTAMLGAVAVIDDIMKTPLLKLPEWWASI